MTTKQYETSLSFEDMMVGLLTVADDMCRRCTALKNEEYCAQGCDKKKALLQAIEELKEYKNV